MAAVRDQAGARAGVLVTVGLIPQATYGAEISGYSDSELLDLRRTAAAAAGHTRGGRSLSRLLALVGDPAARAEVAPITRWCEEVWRVATRADGGLGADALAEAWAAGQRRDCKRWKDAKGPVDVVALTARRIGLTWTSPWEFSGPDGEKWNAGRHSPALIRSQLV